MGVPEIVAISSYAIAIFIELINIALIADMGKWNKFIIWIFMSSLLDLLSFICGIVVYIYGVLYYESHLRSNDGVFYIVFASLQAAFLFWSITMSLLMSYNVHYLLKYSTIFELEKSLVKWLFYFLFSLPVVLIIPAVSIFITKRKDNTYAHVYYGLFLLLFVLPVGLIVVNIVLYLLSWYRSFKITFSETSPLKISKHQTAITALVNRIKFYPIIQSCLYFVMFNTSSSSYYGTRVFFDQYYEIFCSLMIPTCALAYLILFLKMQPNAFDQLKHRIGLAEKPKTLDNKIQPSRITNYNANNIVMSQYDSDDIDYDNLNDDELEIIIRRSSIKINDFSL